MQRALAGRPRAIWRWSRRRAHHGGRGMRRKATRIVKPLYPSPQFAPCLSLGIGELPKGVWIAKVGQFRNNLPEPKLRWRQGAFCRRAAFHQLAIRRQIRLKPVS